MKGSVGLIIAASLGLVAVALNWFYLNEKTRDTDSVSFIGVDEGVTIHAGEYIKESQIVEVHIPACPMSSLLPGDLGEGGGTDG